MILGGEHSVKGAVAAELGVWNQLLHICSMKINECTRKKTGEDEPIIYVEARTQQRQALFGEYTYL